MRRVLVLRPEPGASATAGRVRERGLEPVVIPLFEIEAVDWKAPDAGGFDGLLLTSANAVRCGGEQLKDLRGLPVNAVGAATAEAARGEGFDIASTGDAGVERLLGSIAPELKLLHLAGEDRKIPADVRQEITSVTVYRAKAINDPDLSTAPGRVALIHSPRAGRRFAELVEREKGSIAIAAMNAEAAAAVGAGWAAVQIAESPTDEALLALTERLCNNMPAT
jgi:uroporphyrinogen-III synthase